MRAHSDKWLLRLVIVTVFQIVVSVLGGSTPALADGPQCPAGTNWDSVTQQCR